MWLLQPTEQVVYCHVVAVFAERGGRTTALLQLEYFLLDYLPGPFPKVKYLIKFSYLALPV